MREDVVGDDQGSRLELRARAFEEPLIVALLGVDEDQIEDVVDPRQGFQRISLDEVGAVA